MAIPKVGETISAEEFDQLQATGQITIPEKELPAVGETISAEEFDRIIGLGAETTDLDPTSVRKLSSARPGFIGRVGEAFEERAERGAEAILAGDEQTLAETATQVIGQGAGFVGDIFSEALFGAARGVGEVVKAVTPDPIEEKAKTAASELLQTEPAQAGLRALSGGVESYQAWKAENPREARNLEAIGNILSLIPIERVGAVGAKGVVKAAEEVVTPAARVAEKVPEVTRKTIEETREKIPFFRKTSKEIEDAIDKKTELPKQTKEEILAGVRPDIKKRIEGKTDELQGFFEQARIRNLDDTQATPLAKAAEDTKAIFGEVEDRINDVGTDIGKFRKKISTVKVPESDVQDVIDVFDNQIAKKGLVSEDRRLVTAPGRETIFSDREIKELQDMRDSLVRLKGDPTIMRVIDNRNVIQKNINFAKEVREISAELDPISRAVRSELRKINKKTIGPLEASRLEEFSNLMEVVSEFNALTTRGKNVEFLLKRILSERDRLPKETVEKIREITGKDIQDPATFAKLATDILGNQQQKGLFRQEISNAGADILPLLSPKLAGIKLVKDFIAKGFDEFDLLRGIDPEAKKAEEIADVFLRATEIKKKK